MKFIKTILLCAICAFAVSQASAQYNSNGIITGSGFYYNTQDGAGGLSVGPYSLNYYYPSNLSASQTVIFPGSSQFKKVEQNSAPTINGTITDTLFTEKHFTHLDSVHGLQTLTFYADQYVTPGATVTVRANVYPGDSTRKLYINFGASPVDTISVSNQSFRTYTFNGTTLEPQNK